MDSELIRYLIVCPLVFLAGFVDAMVGGGGFISLPGYLLTGMPVHLAIGTNKLSSSMGTTLATWRLARNGFIPWKQALFAVISALIGSQMGAYIALLIDAHIFKILMLVIIPLTSWYVFRSHSLGATEETGGKVVNHKNLICMAIGLVMGIYDGFYGPGTGTFMLLAFMGLANMNIKEANGITKAANLTTNFGALYVFLTHGTVDLMLGLTAGLFSIAGNYLGTRQFIGKQSFSVRPIILLVLTIFFVKTLMELI